MEKKWFIIITISLLIVTIGLLFYKILFKKNVKNTEKINEVESIVINKKNLNLFIGDKEKLEITIFPESTNNKNIIWESENKEIAKVTNDGDVEGVGVGKTTIIVKTEDGKVYNKCLITVQEKEIEIKTIEKIEIENNVEIDVGESKKLNVTIIPEDLKDEPITWESSNENIVKVENGIVTGITKGEAIITVKGGLEEASCKVKVIVPVEEIIIENNNIEVGEGYTETINPTIIPENASNNNLIWTSSDPNIATVSNGVVTGITKGEAIITVKTVDSKKAATITVKVLKKYTIFYADSDNIEYRKEGELVGTMPNPTKNKYKFLGWYTDPTDGTKVDQQTKVTSNLILYGHWMAIYDHVFIIGIDGLGATFSKVSSPNFDSIFNKYAYRHDVKTEYKTISAQNWGSILTGVAYNTHGITNTNISSKTRNSKSKYPSIFYYTKKAISKAKLVSIVNWEPINHGIIETDLGVNKIHKNSDDEVTNQVINYLKKNGAPTLMFVQFDEVDHAAHTYGGFSKQYYNAAKKADTRLGKIYNAIKSIGALDTSLFIVVADHGETSNGHGGRTKEETSALLAVKGHSVNNIKFDSNVQNRDVAAIALYALGIDTPSHFVAKVPTNLFNK
ncbi:MAG: Ig-like domain-containing protein [Bacilli bacterium]|nr:Ig-like domain-containing protein [Bacilli bacterium]